LIQFRRGERERERERERATRAQIGHLGQLRLKGDFILEIKITLRQED
jgi:hypothetical protein